MAALSVRVYKTKVGLIIKILYSKLLGLYKNLAICWDNPIIKYRM